MKKSVLLILGSLLACSYACATNKNETVPQDVKAFMLLLTAEKSPTFSDYLDFYGPNAEDETQVLLKYCGSNGVSRTDCIALSNSESQAPTQHISRYFSWIRNCYNTVGRNWDVSGQREIKDRNGDTVTGTIYDITLSNSIFELQYVFPNHRYDGLVVAIFKINYKSTKELIKNKYPTC